MKETGVGVGRSLMSNLSYLERQNPLRHLGSKDEPMIFSLRSIL